MRDIQNNDETLFCLALNHISRHRGNAAACMVCGKRFAKVDPPEIPPAGVHPATECPLGHTKGDR